MFQFTKEDVSIVKNLDPAKAHDCDNVSIEMIKICNWSRTFLLRIIFEQSLKEGKFPEIMRKANLVWVHKKEDKKLSSN